MVKVIQPRKLYPRRIFFVATVIILYTIYTYTRDAPGPKNPTWMGHTMGTTYSIKIANSSLGQSALKQLQRDIDSYLVKINKQMSTYSPNSEISQFNKSTLTEPVTISEPFAEVIRFALDLSQQTDGAFDLTVDPLIDLWGFGVNQHKSPPEDEQISEVQKSVGYQHVALMGEIRLQKDIPALRLNLNAIAKGFAVDVVAQLIRSKGETNYLVEMGGELVASGQNFDQQLWKVGVDLPDRKNSTRAIKGVVYLNNAALATSGDYRNYRELADGKIYTHILDPRTGRPLEHRLASVSVLAETCMRADGLATALCVMGPSRGLMWIENDKHAEALFIVREKDGSYTEKMSSGFEKRTSYQE
ncbi:MAG: FAD:protein FMN transferase ApbE [Kiritimatiellae bacterium]|nr:FAD:protein FMN transferase ApbE [Kiritimatiellia bacterium]